MLLLVYCAVYRVGVEGAWSEAFAFRTQPASEQWTPRVAVFGDMGLTNARALEFLLADPFADRIDSVLHIGEVAYDLADENSTVGDAFMNLIESFVTQVPYMFAVGNHESSKE